VPWPQPYRHRQARWQFRATYRQAVRALPRIARRLRRTNVDCFAVGLKRHRGRYRRQVVITAFVRKKADVRPDMRVPRIVHTGRFAFGRPLHLQTDVIEASHPARGSVLASGDAVITRGLQGTCGFAWTDDTGTFLITCGHVITDGGPAPTGSFTVVAGGQSSSASVASIVPPGPGINTCDGAILRLDSVSVGSFTLGHGGLKIGEFGEIGLANTYSYFAGSQQFACQATHHVTNGETKQVGIGGRLFTISEFWELDMQVGLTQAGHSGAVLFRQDGNSTLAVGIVFGRFDPSDPDSNAATVAYAFDLNNVLSTLDFDNF
jgi:hypothetical protein